VFKNGSVGFARTERVGPQAERPTLDGFGPPEPPEAASYALDQFVFDGVLGLVAGANLVQDQLVFGVKVLLDGGERVGRLRAQSVLERVQGAALPALRSGGAVLSGA